MTMGAGPDILPSTYIKNIELFEDSFDTYSIRVHVCVIEERNSNGLKRWSSSKMANHLSILFLSSNDQNINEKIARGQIDLSRSFQRQIKKKNVVLQEKRIFDAKPIEANLKIYYNHFFDFKIEKEDAVDLRVFCTTYLDIPRAATTFNFTPRQTNISYRGPVSSEDIFTSNTIVKQSSYFLKSDGSQYFGPYHLHPDKGYMAGSFHSSEPHDLLTRHNIYNYKISDYRKKTYSRLTKASDRKYSVISKVFDSYEYKKGYNMLFALNIRDLVIRDTKYGRLFEAMQDSIIEDLCQDFVIKSMTIERNRVHLSLKTNKVNSTTEGHTIIENKRIISSRDEVNNLKETIVYRNQKPNVFKEESSNLTNLDSTGRFRTGGRVDRTKPVYALEETNVFAVTDIRFYSLSDLDLSNGKGGTYSYDVELTFKDPTIEYIDNLFKRALTSEKSLSDYHTKMNNRRNYNYDMNKTTQPFKDFYSLNNSSPWQDIIASYNQMFCLLYDVPMADKEDMTKQLMYMLHPNTSTITAVEEMMKIFNATLSSFIKYFNPKRQGFNRHDLKSSPSNTYQGSNLISNKYKLLGTITPNDFSETYKILNFPDGIGFPVTNAASYVNRLNIEGRKFYNDSTNVHPRFLTPTAINNRKEEIEIFSTDEDTALRVNNFFDKRVLKENKMVKNSQNDLFNLSSNSLFMEEALNEDIIPLIEDASKEKFVNSDSYLGQVIDYTDDEQDYKILTKSKKKKSLFDQKLNSIKRKKLKMNKHMFSMRNPNNLLSKMKKKTNQKTYDFKYKNLPNSVKVLFESDKKEIKNNYQNKNTDVFQNIETQNIINVQHFKVAKIEFLAGFSRDSDGNANLSEPIYTPLSNSDLNQIETYRWCRLSWHYDEEVNLNIDHLSMPIANSCFLLNPGLQLGLPVLPKRKINQSQAYDRSLIGSAQREIEPYNIEGLQSTLVFQAENDFVKTKISKPVQVEKRGLGKPLETMPNTTSLTVPNENLTVPNENVTTGGSGMSGGGSMGGGGSSGGGSMGGGGSSGGGY